MIRLSRRDDVSEIFFLFDVDDEDFFVFAEADRNPTILAILKPLIQPFHGPTRENLNGIAEVHAVRGDVARGLPGIPSEAHCMYGLYLRQMNGAAVLIEILRQFLAHLGRHCGHVAVLRMGDAEDHRPRRFLNVAICVRVNRKRTQCTDDVLPSWLVRSPYSVGFPSILSAPIWR